MKKILTAFCFTDIHNMQAMLDYPTTLRTSAVIAAKNAVSEFGKADVTVIGGDNVSDYPDWNKSCRLPKKNFEDIKSKMVDCFAQTAKDEKVIYVAGNNDMILGDLGTDENKPYNTTEFYYTGPMKEKLGELPENEMYTVMSKEKPHEYPYLDAFHYVINGLDFVCINIDPNTSFNTHDGYFTKETLEWVKKKLEEIDPDGTKPIFVVGHLAAKCTRCGVVEEDFPGVTRKEFYDALLGHKNLFYLYGHVHGSNFVYRDYSSGAVLHLGSDLNVLDPNSKSESNIGCAAYEFSFAHMGGLRPFPGACKMFMDDGLTGYGGKPEKEYYESTGTPMLGQYLIFEVYDDRAVFYIRNTGELENYSVHDLPKPYTVYFQK